MDRSLVAAATLLQAASVRPGPPEADEPLPDTIGLLTGLAGGIALLFRHRAPVAVLAATVLAYVMQAAMLGPVRTRVTPVITCTWKTAAPCARACRPRPWTGSSRR